MDAVSPSAPQEFNSGLEKNSGLLVLLVFAHHTPHNKTNWSLPPTHHSHNKNSKQSLLHYKAIQHRYCSIMQNSAPNSAEYWAGCFEVRQLEQMLASGNGMDAVSSSAPQEFYSRLEKTLVCLCWYLPTTLPHPTQLTQHKK